MGLPEGVFNRDYAQDMAIVRTRLQWGLLVGFIILLGTIPMFASSHILNLLITIFITIIAVQGLNILTGYCGQLSLGHAGFVAVGAYASAIMSTKLGFPFLLTLISSGLMAAVIGIIFALPAVRVKGFYLVMTTLAAQIIIMYLISSLPGITGGVAGLSISPAKIGPFVFASPRSFYFLILPITILMVWFAKNIVRTRFGRAFIAIRDNDLAAEIMGVNLFAYKITAFFVACFYAGVAGSLFAYNIQYAHPDFFTLLQSIWYLGMLIVGGLGTIVGAILGATFITLVGEFVITIAPVVQSVLPALATQVSAGFALIVNALVIGLFLVYEPRGFAHRWETLKASYRLWPFSYPPV